PVDNVETARQVATYRRAHPESTIVIYPDWGKNYSWQNLTQTETARLLIDAGADLVLGHGAHRLQGIEHYKEKWIVYNLGNFMFNSKGRYQKLKQPPYSLAAFLDFAEFEGQIRRRLRLYPLLTDNLVTKYQSGPVPAEHVDVVQNLLLQHSANAESELQQVAQDPLGNYFELLF
ncbi:MAG: CapA family protein, partial [Pseudomonadota bacterium]